MSLKRFALAVFVLTALLSLGVTPPEAPAAQSGSSILDDALLQSYEWRNLGPDRGGRSIAVSGVVGQPDVAYFGAVGGGLWKTTDAGVTWAPVTDYQITSASVGAVAVSESDPNIVFIGTGESCIRGNILPGDGIYRSRDAGATWEHVGFEDTDAISKIRIHPTNPDIVYAAVFGKYSVPSEERGVYRSTDGGDTWERVLFRDPQAGAVDIAIDRNNPDVIYASLWRAFRKEYTMSSGGPGSGMFKSTDGGDTWTEITRNPGMPQEGVVGRIGLAVSSADSNVVYSLFENDNGGLFRSEDAGATWELVNDDRAIRQRAFYYTHVHADHQDPNVVYIQNTGLYRSDDGGRTYGRLSGTHGDHHDLWIDPDDPSHLVVGNDGGGAVSVNTGESWTDEDYPTGQFYHVVTTAHMPFHVCGAQQDNSTLCIPSDYNANRFGGGGGGGGFGGGGRGGAAPRSLTEGSMEVSYRVGGGEPGYIAPDPKDVDLFYSGANNGSYVDKYNRSLGISREINPYPWFYSGEPAADMVERWQWTFPIIFSPLDPDTLYVSSNRLWKTTNGGNSWQQLSPDLTRHDSETLGHSGGPITGDMNGPEVYATIFSVGPGKVDIDVIWTGSDDGLVHVTRDGGATWTNVTPPGMPELGRVSQIDASTFNAGAAYVSVRLPLLDDKRPYIFKTNDYGANWTKIVNGMRDTAYVNAVREDPSRQGLLYAATNHGVYISYDDGAHWQELNPNLPDLPIVDLIVEHNELVIASHGRGFWILDNIQPLRQARPGMTDEAMVLFEPAPAYRSADGATFSYWLSDEPDELKLEILDGSGEVLRSFEPRQPGSGGGGRGGRGGFGGFGGGALSTNTGLNNMSWNLQIEPWPSFPGMILWGARPMGPAVPPGTYTVRLTADGRSATTELEVRANPLITDVTVADMQEQYDFSREILAKVTEANNAVIAIRRAKVQVEDRLAASDDAALAAAAERFVTDASEVEANIYQVKNRSGQDPLNFPIKVNNRLANLLGMVQDGDGAPNDGMREVFGIMVEELNGYTDRLQQIWDTDLAALNGELQRLGLDPVDPNDESIELTAPQ
ncbi:MAG: glycosyl hydrolase [Acidobacteriota bacterium]|jgi:photosystem II stability/assembly factor-like uncharacterized protein